MTLSFDLLILNHNFIFCRISQGHFPYTKFEHFGIIRFWVIEQTNIHSDRCRWSLYSRDYRRRE